MKVIVSLLLALSSASAFADKGSITKLFDGKFARCVSENNLGKMAYLPDGLTAAPDRDHGLSVAFILQHFTCEARGEGYEWASYGRPLEPYADKDIYGRKILIKQRNAEAVLVRGGDAAILATIPVDNAASQRLDFGFGIDQLITEKEAAALDSGATVETRATFFLAADITVETFDGKNVQLGRRAGGAYAILLTLKKAADGRTQVVNLQLK